MMSRADLLPPLTYRTNTRLQPFPLLSDHLTDESIPDCWTLDPSCSLSRVPRQKDGRSEQQKEHPPQRSNGYTRRMGIDLVATVPGAEREVVYLPRKPNQGK
jgi:hypothetical protein